VTRRYPRAPREWVREGIRAEEIRDGKWRVVVDRCDAYTATIGTVERVGTRFLFIDRCGRTMLAYASEQEFDSDDAIITYAMAAPSWLLCNWRSRSHRRKAWARGRSRADRTRRRIRMECNAAKGGPRRTAFSVDIELMRARVDRSAPRVLRSARDPMAGTRMVPRSDSVT
jgi:hypothetical protein